MRVIQVGICGMRETWPRAVGDSESVDFACFVEIDDVSAHDSVSESVEFLQMPTIWQGRLGKSPNFDSVLSIGRSAGSPLPDFFNRNGYNTVGVRDWRQSSQSARLRGLSIRLIGVTHGPKIFVAIRAVRAAACRY